jgi:transposase
MHPKQTFTENSIQPDRTDKTTDNRTDKTTEQEPQNGPAVPQTFPQKSGGDLLMPDELWEKIKPLLPPPKPHPLGCHRPRVDDRAAMNAIFLVLRTGMQWNALNHTVLCSSSSAHRRFQEWSNAGVFQKLWEIGLQEYDYLQGIEWSWLSMDGAMTKAPLGGKKNRTQSNRPGKKRSQAKPVD